MLLAFDPDAARILDALASAQRQLGDAVDRLRSVSVRARRLAHETHWRTAAADRFHADAESWRRDVAALAGDLDDAYDEIGRVFLRVEALAWR